jgi:tyrosyl-tRNA synthetase
MSKSLGNYVGIAEAPEVMFAKIMRISDSLMWRWYELLTDTSMVEIAAVQERIARGDMNPMEAKLELARTIVADFHSPADAGRAAEEFNRVVRQKEAPAEIESAPLPEGVAGPNGINVDKLIAKTGLAPSVSEARRKRESGAVEINGARVSDLVIPVSGRELLIQVGRKWKRVLL